MRQLSLILLIVLISSSCIKKPNPFYEELKGVDTGVFRGIEIKDDIHKIKEVERDEYLEVNGATFLRYNYPFKSGLTAEDRYEIEYYFDSEHQLHEVVINAFFKDKQVANEVFLDMENEFSKRFGESEKSEDGYNIWSSETTNTKKLEIAAINDSQNNEALGYISLQINDFDY